MTPKVGLPAKLMSPELTIRESQRDDLATIISLIASDQLGNLRDDPADLDPYLSAFQAISTDPAHLLVVVEDASGELIGTMQVSVLPGLARRGSRRAQIEAVRVAPAARNAGIGRAMIGWAIDYARAQGCALVQLTSDNTRTDAHRFYLRLGFTASHTGFKLSL